MALKSKLHTVSDKIETAQQKLKQIKRSEADIARELDAITAQLKQTRESLAQSKAHLAQARREQKKVAAALAASEKKLSDRENRLATRMAANYRQGPVRYVSVVLGSRSMGEMVGRAQFVRTIVRYDALLIAQIKSDRLDVLRWKREVTSKANEIAYVTQELSTKQNAEAQATQKRRAVLAEAQKQRAAWEQELSALQADSDQIANRLRAAQTVGNLVPFSGGFIHPVPGPVVSTFGMRFHPILHYSRLHAGVDFGASSGTPIAAASGGTVVFSGTIRGYGNVVVVDHGGGISTLYAHCSARLVNEGATVTQGQTIALVGATGLATGPHLHFEVRKNGAPVDPLQAL